MEKSWERRQLPDRLPTHLPCVPGIQICTESIPSRGVHRLTMTLYLPSMHPGGVDYVKVDDLGHTYYTPEAPRCSARELEMIHRAIQNSGRTMVLSVSPGPAQLSDGAVLQQNANLWRMTDDLWDDWNDVKAMFERCQEWQDWKSGLRKRFLCLDLPGLQPLWYTSRHTAWYVTVFNLMNKNTNIG